MTNAIDTVAHWLDPTVDFAGERQGLTGDLVASCIQIFVALVRGPRREGLEDEDLGQLRLQAQKFSLWCDGFDAESGGLDAIIARSEELRDTLLRLLSAVGAALVNLAARPVFTNNSGTTAPSSSGPSIFSRHDSNSVQSPPNHKVAESTTSISPSILNDDPSNQRRRMPRMPEGPSWGDSFACSICGSLLENVHSEYAWQ